MSCLFAARFWTATCGADCFSVDSSRVAAEARDVLKADNAPVDAGEVPDAARFVWPRRGCRVNRRALLALVLCLAHNGRR